MFPNGEILPEFVQEVLAMERLKCVVCLCQSDKMGVFTCCGAPIHQECWELRIGKLEPGKTRSKLHECFLCRQKSTCVQRWVSHVPSMERHIQAVRDAKKEREEEEEKKKEEEKEEKKRREEALPKKSEAEVKEAVAKAMQLPKEEVSPYGFTYKVHPPGASWGRVKKDLDLYAGLTLTDPKVEETLNKHFGPTLVRENRESISWRLRHMNRSKCPPGLEETRARNKRVKQDMVIEGAIKKKEEEAEEEEEEEEEEKEKKEEADSLDKLREEYVGTQKTWGEALGNLQCRVSRAEASLGDCLDAVTGKEGEDIRSRFFGIDEKLDTLQKRVTKIEDSHSSLVTASNAAIKLLREATDELRATQGALKEAHATIAELLPTLNEWKKEKEKKEQEKKKRLEKKEEKERKKEEKRQKEKKSNLLAFTWVGAEQAASLAKWQERAHLEVEKKKKKEEGDKENESPKKNE